MSQADGERETDGQTNKQHWFFGTPFAKKEFDNFFGVSRI